MIHEPEFSILEERRLIILLSLPGTLTIKYFSNKTRLAIVDRFSLAPGIKFLLLVVSNI